MRRCLPRLRKYGSLRDASPVVPKDTEVTKYLNQCPESRVTTLDNGFRVVSTDMKGDMATVGVFIDAGSRYEKWENNGVAHFLEHMTFKGTTTRTKREIETYFEFSGGHLDAYTTREQTVYFVQTMTKNVPDSMDRICDILRRCRLLSSDVEMERPTIMTEKRDVEMNVDEVVMDHVHLTCFPTDGLGMTILGTTENITKNIDVAMIKDYIANHYTAKRMIMVGSGGVDHDALVSMAASQWGDLPSNPPKPSTNAVFTPGHTVVEYPSLPYPNVAIVWGCPGQCAEEIVVLQVVEYLFGSWNRQTTEASTGDSLITKANVDLAKMDGSLETCQAFITPYTDVCLFGFYMVTGEVTTPDKMKQFQFEVARKLLEVLSDVTEEELSRAKESLKMNCLLLVNGCEGMTDTVGAQMLAHGRPIPLREVYGRIDAVTLEEVREVVGKFIMDKPFCVTGVGKPECIPEEGSLSNLWQKNATYQSKAYAA